MFERQKFKNRAKAQLRGHWLVPVLISLLCTVLLFLIILPQFISGIIQKRSNHSFLQFYVMLVSYSAQGVFAMVFAKYYLVFTENPTSATFSVFLESFNLWLRGILSFFWRFLWTCLWSLLFCIPGIIKSLAYSQIFFIIAENPNISIRKAMRLSIVITKGYKGDLFVLELSFIGWALLCLLTCGIGYFWLAPYISATQANTYRFLKQSAFDRGVLKPEDFGAPTLATEIQ